jgi:hypothetical protein
VQEVYRRSYEAGWTVHKDNETPEQELRREMLDHASRTMTMLSSLRKVSTTTLEQRQELNRKRAQIAREVLAADDNASVGEMRRITRGLRGVTRRARSEKARAERAQRVPAGTK